MTRKTFPGKRRLLGCSKYIQMPRKLLPWKSFGCAQLPRHSEAPAAMAQGGPATAWAGARYWCCPCDTGLWGALKVWENTRVKTDEMARPVKQMQEREIGATEAPALRGEPRGLSLARLQGTWPLKLTSRCRTEGYRVLLAAGFGSTLPFWNASVYPESLHTASV